MCIRDRLETSRRGYLAASSASAYSMVSLVQKFGPIMNEGGAVLSLTYIASEQACRCPPHRLIAPRSRWLGLALAVAASACGDAFPLSLAQVIPGYGGGMSSAKSQLESDTRVLAYEAGRKYGIRINTVSAGASP